MYKENRVAAVVSAYNEETLIGKVITTMPDYVDHIVVVDDCSTDGTYQAARRSPSASSSTTESASRPRSPTRSGS